VAGLIFSLFATPNSVKATTVNLSVTPKSTMDASLSEGVWRQTRPPVVATSGISFISPQQGWIAHGRTVGYTQDGGNSWVEQSVISTKSTNYLLDVDFVDANYGWACATGATIFHTVDGGNTWSPLSSPLTDYVVAIEFMDHDHGWAMDRNTLIHTNNGGLTWTSQSNRDGHSLLFLDLLHGWVVNDSSIMRTTDGGTTWQTYQFQFVVGGISFINTSDGWLAGSAGQIRRTSDGGATWTDQTSGTSMNLSDISFVDQHRGWAVGWGPTSSSMTGIILGTTDGGNTWIPRTTFSSEGMNKVCALNQASTCVLGNLGSILRTNDAGLTWVYQSNGVSTEICTLDFVDENNGWAGGISGNILHTTDGGYTWKPQESTIGWPIQKISFADLNNGWAAVWNTIYDVGAILHTSNGGATWEWQVYGIPFFDIAAIDALTAWAGGWDGLYNTTDGGKTWNKVNFGQNYGVNLVKFIDPLHGWLLAGGHTVHTSNGGVSWEISANVVAFTAVAMEFVNDRVGWIVQDFVVHRTTDGGNTWSTSPSFSTGLRGIDFIDEQNGWMVGAYDKIFHSTDGGITWSEQPSNVEWFLSGPIATVIFPSSTHGIAMGAWGATIHYETNHVAPPNLTSPADGANSGGNAVTFQWSPSSGATNYRLRVNKVSDNTEIIDKAVGNVNLSTETGFPNNGTQYKWALAAGDSTGWGALSAWRTFTNGVFTVPDAPSLMSPGNGGHAIGPSVNFQWAASTGATNYWLAVVKASDNSVLINRSVGNATSFTRTGFIDDGTQYKWAVAAGNNSGWGPCSPWWVFTNGQVVVPDPPSLTSPADGAVISGNAVTFQWSTPGGATNYWLAVVKASDNSVLINKAVGNTTNVVATGFPNDGTQYRWVVAAGDNVGWSEASTSRTFTNGTRADTPPAPSLTSPAVGATVTGTSVTFQWAASSGATNYWLTVLKASDNSVLINKAVGNVTSDVESGFPNNGTQYKWVVAAGNSAGWGSASTARTFTNGTVVTIPLAPSLTSPADGATVSGTSVNFQWAGSSGATNYWLAVVKAIDNSVIINKAVGNVTSSTETGFSNDGTAYRWVVAAGNNAGWGSASAIRTFISGTSMTVPIAPGLTSPADGAKVTGTSVTFQWSSSSGATNYWLAVVKVSDNSVIINKDVGNVTSDVENVFPNSGTQYRWVVAAGNSAGWGAASTTRVFTNGP
jgi:photosystem II stability/assembly factor-like uncharacterized protein